MKITFEHVLLEEKFSKWLTENRQELTFSNVKNKISEVVKNLCGQTFQPKKQTVYKFLRFVKGSKCSVENFIKKKPEFRVWLRSHVLHIIELQSSQMNYIQKILLVSYFS